MAYSSQASRRARVIHSPKALRPHLRHLSKGIDDDDECDALRTENAQLFESLSQEDEATRGSRAVESVKLASVFTEELTVQHDTVQEIEENAEKKSGACQQGEKPSFARSENRQWAIMAGKAGFCIACPLAHGLDVLIKNVGLESNTTHVTVPSLRPPPPPRACQSR